MIFKILELVIWFILIWIGGFALHEICHWIIGTSQGIKCKIRLWWHNGFPSLMCSPTSPLDNKISFLLAGGSISGIILLGIAWILYCLGGHPPVIISLFIVGSINLVYSIYEVSCHPMVSDMSLTQYMQGKNKTYGIVGLISFFLMIPLLIMWFG